jgi:hypothetical protein
MNPCPQCNSQRIVGGWLGTDSKPAMFRPAGLRSFTVTQDGGARLATADASACLDCGLVWGDISTKKLREFIDQHCRSSNSVSTTQCLKCGSNRIARGKIIGDHRPSVLPVVFDPAGRQAFTFTLGGTRLIAEALACLDCGLAWNSTSPEKLRKYIQRHCDQTSDNAVAFEGCEPSSGWKERWIGGIVVALIPTVYGIYCLYTGHAYVPRRRQGFVDLQSWDVVVVAIAWIALGAFLHLEYFWGRHPRLRCWSRRLKGAAMLVFIGGWVFVAFRRSF